MKVPIDIYNLEINLDDLNFELLIQYVQDQSDCTLVDNDRLRFLDWWEEDFTELIKCFEKHSLNKIRKQQIIQSVIDQLDGNQVKNLLKV